MSTITKSTGLITLDGSKSFTLGGDVYNWNNFWILDAYGSTTSTLTVSYNIAGKDWNVGMLHFSGSSAAVITDSSTGTEAANNIVWIDHIDLYGNGPNSVTLNNAEAGSINGGSNSDNVKIGVWAEFVSLGRGNDTFTLTGTGEAEMVDMGRGNDIVNIGAGWVMGVDMGRGNDLVTIGTGSFEAIDLGRDSDTIRFSANSAGDGHIDGGENVSSTSEVPGAKDFDTLDFSALTKALTVDFAAKTAKATGIDYQVVNFESVVGGTQGDVISGAQDADTLDGRGGNDTLDGRAGNDILIGGAGADKLTGGLGADSFVYKALSDSTSSVYDTILDFNVSQSDKINLSAIDANSKTTANDAFVFIGTGAFSGTADQLRYQTSSSGTDIYADVNGDKVADLRIHLSTAQTLHATDFVL